MEELKTSDYLKGIVLNLPESPGVYQYLNTEGTIIYVGKAKNLKRRVSSYFNREHEPGKTRVLVSKIADIRYIVVNTEEDALLLENNLIKKYKPRYNVLLKDDKNLTPVPSAYRTNTFHAYSRHEESYATALRTMVRTATYRPCMRCSTLSSIYIRYALAT